MWAWKKLSFFGIVLQTKHHSGDLCADSDPPGRQAGSEPGTLQCAIRLIAGWVVGISFWRRAASIAAMEEDLSAGDAFAFRAEHLQAQLVRTWAGVLSDEVELHSPALRVAGVHLRSVR